MYLNPVGRFLKQELNQIEVTLNWVDTKADPLLASEYERRFQIICELLAHTPDMQAVLEAAQRRLADAAMLRDELLAAGSNDAMLDALEADAAYLGGIVTRLQHVLTVSTIPYALADVQRL